nr:MAG TPA: hypothetical protein [Microviridae sp.]DAU09386.1 MAG TPA: hypothetical protein [Microviridae sp.]DAU54386.1 MAG TPA: hypothetical protein [Microviridae sp.]
MTPKVTLRVIVEVACTCLERMQYFKIKCLVGDPRRIQVPKK